MLGTPQSFLSNCTVLVELSGLAIVLELDVVDLCEIILSFWKKYQLCFGENSFSPFNHLQQRS